MSWDTPIVQLTGGQGHFGPVNWMYPVHFIDNSWPLPRVSQLVALGCAMATLSLTSHISILITSFSPIHKISSMTHPHPPPPPSFLRSGRTKWQYCSVASFLLLEAAPAQPPSLSCCSSSPVRGRLGTAASLWSSYSYVKNISDLT